jgi:surface protein
LDNQSFSIDEDSHKFFYKQRSGICSYVDIVQDPEHGHVMAFSPNNDYVYIPNENYHGNDTFNYRVCHAGDCTSAVKVNIHIKSINDIPIVRNKNYRMSPGESVSVSYGKGFDPDGPDETLIYEIFTKPNHGTFKNFIYTADKNFKGIDSVKYSVKDSQGGIGYGRFYFNIGVRAPLILRWRIDKQQDFSKTHVQIKTNKKYSYEYQVDWGDGHVDKNLKGDCNYTYAEAGDYTVTIGGDYPHLQFEGSHLSNYAGTLQLSDLIGLEQWGSMPWKNTDKLFADWANMRILCSDQPDMSHVVSAKWMLNNVQYFNEPINDWDVSNVVDFSAMLMGTAFNQPLDKWNVSKAQKMWRMFSDTSFDQDISQWDVSSVTNMESMFCCSAFNHPIDNWDVFRVKNMSGMFSSSSFNQPINSWDISNVTSMSSLFSGSVFNQPLNGWDVSRVTSMENMFADSCFNHPIDHWDVSSVREISFMFYGAKHFNQNLSSWNLLSATSLAYVFAHTQAFQKDLAWKTPKVGCTLGMFEDSCYNGSLNDWDVSSIGNMENMFKNNKCFNQPLDRWSVKNVASMDNLFAGAKQFDQDLSSWNITGLTSYSSINGGHGGLQGAFSGTSLSPKHYDSMLKKWAEEHPNKNIILGAENTKYTSSAKNARNKLISEYGWKITDGGLK